MLQEQLQTLLGEVHGSGCDVSTCVVLLPKISRCCGMEVSLMEQRTEEEVSKRLAALQQG